MVCVIPTQLSQDNRPHWRDPDLLAQKFGAIRQSERRQIRGRPHTIEAHVSGAVRAGEWLAWKFVDELAASTGANAEALCRVLRALAIVGVFTEAETRQFALTRSGTCLRLGVPDSVRALVRTLKWEWAAWGEMLHAVQTAETGFRCVRMACCGASGD